MKSRTCDFCEVGENEEPLFYTRYKNNSVTGCRECLAQRLLRSGKGSRLEEKEKKGVWYRVGDQDILPKKVLFDVQEICRKAGIRKLRIIQAPKDN